MSHHSNSNAHIKQVLTDVLNLATSYIYSASREINKLNITDSNIGDRKPEELRKLDHLVNIMNIINDVIHPAHELASELLPHTKELIDMCKVNQIKMRDAKRVDSNCSCYSCKIEKPL